MWRCGECGRRFANRNQFHSCRTRPLAEHFAGKPRARELFDLLLTELDGAEVISSLTRIALQDRISFLALMPRHYGLRGHLLLHERVGARQVVRIEQMSSRTFIHHIVLRSEGDIDAEFRALLQRARREATAGPY